MEYVRFSIFPLTCVITFTSLFLYYRVTVHICVIIINIVEVSDVWLGGQVVRTLDLWSIGREFESWPFRYRVQPWASC